MLLTIADLIDPDQLPLLRDELANLTWRDGRVTAGKVAKGVKKNEQADLTSNTGRKFHSIAMAAISSHPVILAAARPKRFSNLLVSRTSDGGHYGPHMDNALMKKSGDVFRSDLSFTLFLTPPEDYDGGELIIHTAGTTQAVKCAAGDLVLYPSSHLHEVAPVTRGVRLACVGWIESLIADDAKRDMLFDLENLRVSLRASLPTQSAELLTLDKTVANLLRMWANP